MKPQIILVFLLKLASTQALAQEIEAVFFEYPYEVQVYDLSTSSNGIEYRLYVRPPLREPGPGEKPSVFYFLDALRNFVPAAAMSYNYEYFNYIPAAISWASDIRVKRME